MRKEIYLNHELQGNPALPRVGAKGCFEGATRARSDFRFILRPVFQWPHSEHTEIGRDSQRGSQKNEPGENRSWAVATPLCATWQPPNASGFGGRYRPSCSSD